MAVENLDETVEKPDYRINSEPSLVDNVESANDENTDGISSYKPDKIMGF